MNHMHKHKDYNTADYNKQINKHTNKQKKQGLKLLTPNQVLIKLPITLVQLKAGSKKKQKKKKIRLDIYYIHNIAKIN